MHISDLSALDQWTASGSGLRVTRADIDRLRTCCRLLGVADGFCDDASEGNFHEKVQRLKQEKKAASNSFGAALLSSRDREDVGDILSAIAAFETFIVSSRAEAYKAIARHEIDRLKRRSATAR